MVSEFVICARLCVVGLDADVNDIINNLLTRICRHGLSKKGGLYGNNILTIIAVVNP